MCRTHPHRSENVRAQQQLVGKQKHDLSKWKYSELRDAINTSCDIELLEVYRERRTNPNLQREFHTCSTCFHCRHAVTSSIAASKCTTRGRQRTANAPQWTRTSAPRRASWRRPPKRRRASSRSRRSARRRIDTFAFRLCAPTAAAPPAAIRVSGVAAVVFFLLGCVFNEWIISSFCYRLADKRGLWYAHFDGQYVARQMELHADKSPILLVAGRHLNTHHG